LPTASPTEIFPVTIFALNDVTHILEALAQGDPTAADDLLPRVYQELRKLAAQKMANETPGQTLQPTALVHEAWLRLAGSNRQQWRGRSHFFGAAAEASSIIDSSALTNLIEVSGIASPDDSTNGEIIITTVLPPPLAISTGAAFGFTNGVFGFDVTGPSGSNVVIQASTDLQTWIPLQTNLLSSGPLHFSDAQPPANARRFYRAKLLQ
jgi:hypothetical protein